MISTKRSVTTLDDVAHHAGVSKFTVSRVLNGTLSNTRVSEATHKRILDTVEKLRYQPNALSRSLRRKRTGIIGTYFGFEYVPMTTPFLSHTVRGFQNGCNTHRYDLLVHGTYRGQGIKDIYGELAGGKIDGLILLAPQNDPLATMLAESHLPVVAVADALPGIPSVVVDDVAAGQLQARHLAARNHDHVLFVGSDRAQTSSLRRREAFLSEARLLGLRTTEVLTQTALGAILTPELIAQITRSDRDRPTAAACWSDGIAQAVMVFCLASAVAIPETLAVVGCDGFATDVIPAQKLTTVYCPWEAVGEKAVTLLHRYINETETEISDETVFPVEWIAGDTA